LGDIGGYDMIVVDSVRHDKIVSHIVLVNIVGIVGNMKGYVWILEDTGEGTCCNIVENIRMRQDNRCAGDVSGK
jgi:hypothetical protein